MDDLKLYGKSKTEIQSLLNTVQIFSKDIAMEFGLGKCATLTVNRGKRVETSGVYFPKNSEVKRLPLEEATST